MKYSSENVISCAGCLLVYPCFVVSWFTTLPLVAKEGLRSLIVTLPGDLFIVFFNYYNEIMK